MYVLTFLWHDYLSNYILAFCVYISCMEMAIRPPEIFLNHLLISRAGHKAEVRVHITSMADAGWLWKGKYNHSKLAMRQETHACTKRKKSSDITKNFSRLRFTWEMDFFSEEWGEWRRGSKTFLILSSGNLSSVLHKFSLNCLQ